MAQDGEQRGAGRYWGGIRESKDEILNVRRELERRRGPLAGLTVRIGGWLATPGFFVGVTLLHAGWLVLNLPGVAPGLAWDPPPFPLLAMIASVEAPLLALLVLMRQEHDRRIAELREETALQVSLHSERENSAQVRLLLAIAHHLEVEGIDDLADFAALQEPVDPKRLVRAMRRGLEAAESGE